MPLSEMDVKRYRAYFYSTVVGDIEKLIKTAQEGEREYNDRMEAEEKEPKRAPTTMSPNSLDFLIGGSQPARCTVPLAMTYLSAMELIGALLGGYNSQFSQRVGHSFEYGGFPLDHQTTEVLRGIFRNGMMHCFLPQGELVGIKYDSSYDGKTDLFVEEGSVLTLNVNFLSRITLRTLDTLFHSETIVATILPHMEEMLNTQALKTAPLITAYAVADK